MTTLFDTIQVGDEVTHTVTFNGKVVSRSENILVLPGLVYLGRNSVNTEPTPDEVLSRQTTVKRNVQLPSALGSVIKAVDPGQQGVVWMLTWGGWVSESMSQRDVPLSGTQLKNRIERLGLTVEVVN